MSIRTIIGVVTAAAVIDCRRVWNAQGLGTENFTIKLCANEPGVTWETPATHYALADWVEYETAVAWLALEDGILPTIWGTWGEDGIIDEASALAAISAENLEIFCGPGALDQQIHLNSILSTLSLVEVPDRIYE